jgi:hypothetical protein
MPFIFCRLLLASAAAAQALVLAGCASYATGSTTYRPGDPIPAGQGVAVIRVDLQSTLADPFDLERLLLFGLSLTKLDGETAAILHDTAYALGNADAYAAVGDDKLVFLLLPATGPGERYAASQLRLNRSMLATQIPLACQGRRAATFELKAGEVRYVGDYHVDLRGTASYKSWNWWFNQTYQPTVAGLPDIERAALEPRAISHGAACRG